jgi:DNA-binding NtrC family response regulator/tetratricopeptide (TPR) repeat protein
VRKRTIDGPIVYEVFAASRCARREFPRNIDALRPGRPLAVRVDMPQVVADRFVRANDVWIDLGTGQVTTLRILPAGSQHEQFAWNTHCAVLANLRHPLINPLIDYGIIDRHRRFEAYAARSPIQVSTRMAGRLTAHGLRFLDAHKLPHAQSNHHLLVRSIDRTPSTRAFARSLRAGRLSSMRPLGVVLQSRAVYDAIADALDAMWPAGPTRIVIAGSLQSGLRTARLIAARLARLRGYVPIDAGVVERHSSFVEAAADRHICVLADERQAAGPSVRMLMTRLGFESARRHVLLVFARPQSDPPSRWITIERMGVTAMSGMIFVDHEQGPTATEIVEAMRIADGRPGVFLEHLGSRDYEPIRSVKLAVHEMPQLYDASASAAPSGQRSVGKHRTDALMRGAMARADLLVLRGRHASASRLLSRATRLLLGRGASDAGAETAVHLGFVSLDRGLLADAAAAFERAREAAPASRAAIRAAIGIGLVWIDQGRLVEAEAILRTSVLSSGHDERSIRLQGACALARCLYWMGRLDEARLALNDAPALDGVPETVRMMTMRARIELGEGLVTAAVRSARGAVDLASQLRDTRGQAGAYRSLAAALASAGDEPAAAVHIRDGLIAATTAHLPLAAARLRLTFAEIRGAPCQRQARRIVKRVMTPRYPPLLQAFARAVLARIDVAELDARTRSFIAASGAALVGRPSLATATNPVTELESFLDIAHSAPDDRNAIERIAQSLQSKLRAVTVMVVATAPERRVLSVAGRPWQGDPHVAWRASGAAVGVGVDTSLEPCQAAEPIRYAGEVIGAVAIRWIAGVAIDSARVSSLLRIACLSLAPHVRAVLDHAIPASANPSRDDLLGDSEPACSLRDDIARAARAPFPVLIQGESGSGKELVARTIHRLGSRRDRRFCALNCAALTDELIEAELFGHARGAFTGAVGERAGLFEEADGGTLFLDEIGELSARAQAKLLRVLQDGEVRRVGENLSRRVDVRIVAATNRRLDQEAAAGRFRVDLRFRLDVIRIEVPPLRDRATDVPLLASRFWNEAAGRVGSRATLAPEAVALLTRYEWPGNVRELQNVIAWIAVQSPRRGRIGATGLPSHIARACPSSEQTTFEAARQEFERRFVKAALARADGQRARAAQALGITRQGLAKMMRRLGLE